MADLGHRVCDKAAEIEGLLIIYATKQQMVPKVPLLENTSWSREETRMLLRMGWIDGSNE